MNALLAAVAALRKLTDALLGGLFDFIDQRNVVRRAILAIVLWQLVDVYIFAKQLAVTKSGIEVSAYIAALTVPVTLLVGFLGKVYSDSRDAQSKPEP